MDETLKIQRLQDMDLKDKRVLVRVDYNVPLKGDVVTDATRIKTTMPTLKHLRDAGCRIALIAHLGRPKGQVKPEFSLKPVAAELEKILGSKVRFAGDCVGEKADKVVGELGPGDVALLENLRFHAEETKNGEDFAKALAKHGDVFIQDAFGALHRSHASTAGVPAHLPGGIGFLVQKELQFLDRAISNPERPFLAILGGAKVSDKIKVIHRLLDRVNMLLIGGGMSYTFLQSHGVSIGKSLLQKETVADAKEIIGKAYAKSVECLLPADHLTVEGKIDEKAETSVSQGMAINEEHIGVDIGPRTVALFTEKIQAAKTIFWNGPMGIFEMPPFSKGSVAIAKALAKATEGGATTIVGGGDSLAVLKVAKLKDKMSHCSTGGGASLEFLEGKTLPGLAALKGG